MKRILPQVFELKDRRLHVEFTCIDEHGMPAEAVSATLLDLVQMSCWGTDSLENLRALVRQAESGQYLTPNAQLPDFGINDVNLWLAPPMAPIGHLTVTNENTIYDSESSDVQHFTFAQFWQALDFWQVVLAFVREHGAAALRSHPLERSFP